MDPDVALAQLRMLTTIVLTANDAAPAETSSQVLLIKMSEIFEGLDEWLKKGGAKPASWSK